MLGERDEALGEVWHIPSSEPTTGREFVRAIFEEAGNPPKIGALSSTMVKTLDLVWPLAREGAEVVYQFERPVVLDGSKYRRAFGGCEVTAYREGIRQTIDWYRQGFAIEKLSDDVTRERQVPHQDHVGSNLVEEDRYRNVPPLRRKEAQG
jgi:nucleoside-diphosphate-sugar epimerase